MSQIFDRLERLFKSYVNDTDDDDWSGSSYTRGFDQDMKNAWDEMEEFLDTGKTRTQSRPNFDTGGFHQSPRPAGLDQDYKNLEISPDTDFEEVKKVYKKLILKYHPDRFAGNPEKQAHATEIMKKLNASFQNIKQYESTR